MTLNLVRLFTTKHRRYKLNGCFISYLLSFPPLLQSKHVKSDIEVNCINLDIYAPAAPAVRQSFHKCYCKIQSLTFFIFIRYLDCLSQTSTERIIKSQLFKTEVGASL